MTTRILTVTLCVASMIYAAPTAACTTSQDCSPLDQWNHVKQHFEFDTKNTTKNLSTLCADPGAHVIKYLTLTDLVFKDGARQTIFPLFIAWPTDCAPEACRRATVHFIALEQGKIRFAYRQIGFNAGEGAEWHGKDGNRYGFAIETAQTSEFESPMIGGTAATLCEGFDQARADKTFQTDAKLALD